MDPQGPVAAAIDELWWLMLGLGIAVFAVFLVLLVIGLVREPTEQADADPQRRIRRWLVGGGVVLPLVVVTVVFGATVRAMQAVPGVAPPGALVVEIIGHQWRYEVGYPEEGVTAVDELHLPVGRPVALHLTSADVIHSFWVPELGGKLDMLPDGTNVLVLQADRPGQYTARCAEFCGLGHASMQLDVVAESPEAFASWVAAQQ
ncbi:MAG: cytochrome c oxidase subunit II [Mycobacteriales bacterium]